MDADNGLLDMPGLILSPPTEGAGGGGGGGGQSIVTADQQYEVTV